jgi:hypothetical protein
MIDKSIRTDYVIQGGGPNYLGKQKMVKAPKKWQSSPDHDPAELAYITEKEKDILIALDVHESLKDGKPNRGPSGIISLQGDLGGYGGSGGSRNGGGGNGGGWSPSVSYTPPARTPHREPTKTEQMMAEATRMETARKAQETRDAAKAAAEAIEDLDEAEAIRADLQKPIDDAARVREILTRGRGTEVPGERLFEDRISKYAVDEIDPVTGEYNAEAIQKAAAKESRARALGIGDPLTTEQITSLPTSTRIADFVPTQTRVENLQKAGSQFLPSFSMEGAKQYATNKLRNFAVKTGLGELGITGVLPQTFIPWGISKLFGGKKDPLRTVKKQIAKFKKPSLDTNWQGEKKRTKTFHEPREDGERVAEKTTVQEAVAGKKPLGINLEDIRKKQMIMKTALDEGYYTDNEGRRIQLTDQHKKMLTNYITQIDKYLIDPRAMAAYGGRIDKALGGRSRDIG